MSQLNAPPNSLLPQTGIVAKFRRIRSACATGVLSPSHFHLIPFDPLRNRRMWCPACRADVAAELSSDNRRYGCARCQTELGLAIGASDRSTTPVRSLDTERNARELLARWSTQNLLDATGTAMPAPGTGDVSTGGVHPAATGNGLSSRSGYRLDAAHPTVPTPTVATQEAATANTATDAPVLSDAAPPARRRKVSRPRIAELPLDDLATTTTRHDEQVRNAVAQLEPQRTNWATMAGQLCAYGGVGLLTCGTVLVLSGSFGGPAHYAPTGWLVAAVGQMLLFLGVVTLVSGGMEQTVDEVAWRMDHLSERIGHLERMIEQRDRRERRMLRPRKQQQPDDRADAA